MPFGKEHYQPFQQSIPPELSTANGNGGRACVCSQESFEARTERRVVGGEQQDRWADVFSCLGAKTEVLGAVLTPRGAAQVSCPSFHHWRGSSSSFPREALAQGTQGIWVDWRASSGLRDFPPLSKVPPKLRGFTAASAVGPRHSV